MYNCKCSYRLIAVSLLRWGAVVPELCQGQVERYRLWPPLPSNLVHRDGTAEPHAQLKVAAIHHPGITRHLKQTETTCQAIICPLVGHTNQQSPWQCSQSGGRRGIPCNVIWWLAPRMFSPANPEKACKLFLINFFLQKKPQTFQTTEEAHIEELGIV